MNQIYARTYKRNERGQILLTDQGRLIPSDHEEHHLDEAEQTKRFEVHRPRIEKDDLHIEEHEQDGDQEILDTERRAGVPILLDPALEVVVLDLTGPFRSQPSREYQATEHEAQRKKGLDRYRNVVVGGTHDRGQMYAPASTGDQAASRFEFDCWAANVRKARARSVATSLMVFS